MIRQYLLFCCALIFTWRVAPALCQTDKFSESVQKPVNQAIQIRQATQQDQEAWIQEKERLTRIFDELVLENNRLKEEKATLQQQNAATQQRITAKQRQLDDVKQISKQIQPFLEDTLARLEAFIQNDMPFLMTERRQRVARLHMLIKNPEISFSEKFRKIMEALLVEMEYGVTIEMYQETIITNGAPLLANIFRLGRLSLFFQSLDSRQCGYYDVATRTWQPLPKTFNRDVQTAIDVAAKRRPVELLNMPLGRMVVQ